MKNSSRCLVALEIFFVFALIMAQIWILPRGFRPITGVLIFGSIIVSVIDGWKHLQKKMAFSEKLTYCAEYVGLGRWEKWKVVVDFSQAKILAFLTLISLVGMTSLALIINPGFWKRPDFWDEIHDQLLRYAWWAIVQQVLLQGYVTNRLEIVCHKKWLTAFVAGGIFGIIHYPNPVLMPGTFLLGSIGAYFFLKARNVYLLGLIHAILGTAVKYLIAYDLLDHPMRVGPGFWE